MIKFIMYFLKNEDGVDPVTLALIGGGIAGGSTLLGSILGKNKGAGIKEPWEDYGKLGEQLTSTILGKIGQPGTQYPGSFNLPQPATESMAESTILGKLKNPVQPSAFSKDITDKYKTSLQEEATVRAEKRELEEKEMYNRLGLSTSTPWLQRKGELGKELETELGGISSQFAYEDIAREIQATQLAEEIMQNYLSQAQILGQQQRGYSQYEQGAGYQDWLRAYNEPYQWASLGSSLLGQGQSYYDQGSPNIWSQIGQTGQDIGSLLLMSSILKGA